jgi:hypothetical protein
MTTMSSTLLRWLARCLMEAACRAVALWAVDTCNTEPPILRPGHHLPIEPEGRSAMGILSAACTVPAAALIDPTGRASGPSGGSAER